MEEIMGSIDEMPLVDSPEVYQLHPNADITYQTNTAKLILGTIVDIQPKEGGAGGGETREDAVYRISNDMLQKLPPDYVPHEVKSRLVKMGLSNPLNIFLKQELDRMQKVIGLVRGTLSDLQLAIDGTIIMSEDLRDALDNIYDARVPNKWKKISWDSSTIGFWFTELVERNAQFRDWCFNGRPYCLWMTGFFNPQGFLTAMRQEVTRMHKGWALDAVVLHNDVTSKLKEDFTSGPSEGVYVHGLFLDGAGWDRKNCKLQESQPKVLFVPLPVVHIYAINCAVVNPKKMQMDTYACPTYKKSQRTDLTFITPLYLKCGGKKEQYWILRGVALLCDVK
jgi:dynein heavy chain